MVLRRPGRTVKPTKGVGDRLPIEMEVLSLLGTTFVGYQGAWGAMKTTIEWDAFVIRGFFPHSELIATFRDLASGTQYQWHQALWDAAHPPVSVDQLSAQDMFDNLMDIIREGLESLWRPPVGAISFGKADT